jgi:hypothetical protein
MTKLYIKQRKVKGAIRIEVLTPEEYASKLKRQEIIEMVIQSIIFGLSITAISLLLLIATNQI